MEAQPLFDYKLIKFGPPLLIRRHSRHLLPQEKAYFAANSWFLRRFGITIYIIYGYSTNLRQHAKSADCVTICVKDRAKILSAIVKPVGVGALDDPQIQLTTIGKIIEKNLLSSENISGVKIDRYVIMPDHIHAIE